MKQTCRIIGIGAVLLTVGCVSVPDLERATLRPKNPNEAGSYLGFYTFRAGELASTAVPDEVDIAYYFDGDDCAQGALIGHDDRPGYLFPIGHKPWSELVKLPPPSTDEESIVAIMPLSKDKEGLAMWVKTGDGQFVLVRIAAVEPASYADLVAGVTPTLEIEWIDSTPAE